jgi:hypothetical protein
LGPSKERTTLNEQVEKEKKRTNRQEDCAAIDFAARRASQTSDEAAGTGFAGDLFAETAAEAGDRVANDFTPDGTDFVVHPDGNVQPVGPEHNCSANKYRITNQCEKAEC